MKAYAGIGSRETPEEFKTLIRVLALNLASKGYALNTGLAIGADQSFIEGAVLIDGFINLYLPWKSYERKWLEALLKKYNSEKINITVYDRIRHEDAYNSVEKYHPRGKWLKRPVVCLHARNYLIIKDVEFVICYTRDGKDSGGTGQGIRIARDLNKPVYNLANKADIDKLCRLIRKE